MNISNMDIGKITGEKEKKIILILITKKRNNTILNTHIYFQVPLTWPHKFKTFSPSISVLAFLTSNTEYKSKYYLHISHTIMISMVKYESTWTHI